MAASKDCNTAASSWWRALCSLESAVMSQTNGVGLLIVDKGTSKLLRLQPRLRYHLRTQLAQKPIDLVNHGFRLRGLYIELEHASRRKLCAPRLRHESCQPLRLNRRLLREFDRHGIALAVNGQHAHTFAQQLQSGRRQQITYRRRRLAIAVLQFLADIIQRRFTLHARGALIHAQALVLFCDISWRNAQIDAEIELRADFVGKLL